MNMQASKLAAIKGSLWGETKVNPTPKIPGLKLKPNTGYGPILAVPDNLPTVSVEPKNPQDMCAEAVAFLCLRAYPGRLNVWQTSVLLGVTEDDIRILLRLGVVTSLNDQPGVVRYFGMTYVLGIRDSYEQMQAITIALNRYWAAKAAAKAASKIGKKNA